MIVQRLFDPKLAQTSYLVGCARTGEAVVVDPNRDVAQYLRAAEAEGLRITHVTETHIHADFVSGARDLAERTGAALYLSGEGGAGWQYAYAAEAGAVLLRHGDAFMVGNVRLEAVHTPGHTPEHLSFLVTDTAAADAPIAAITGDFVFVGDVGRPDLLERAAGHAGTMDHSARTLHASLRRFANSPEWLQIWPGHGAGSACGKGLSAVPHSTVGYERRYNWAFGAEYASDDPAAADAFARAVLAGQPEPPRYFARMKQVNRDGPPPLAGLPRPRRLPTDRLEAALASGAAVVDTRPASAYAASHVAGTLSIPLNRSFPTWAGSLLPDDRDVYLVVDDRTNGGAEAGCAACAEERAREAVRDLALVGIDRVVGVFDASAVLAWAQAGQGTASVPQVSADALAEALAASQVAVVDVRGADEWGAGHLRGAVHVPLDELPERLTEIPRDRPVVVHCRSGARSAIAASVLRAAGVPDVGNLTGGFTAWQNAGLPVVGEETR